MKVSLQFGSCGMMDVRTAPEGRLRWGTKIKGENNIESTIKNLTCRFSIWEKKKKTGKRQGTLNTSRYRGPWKMPLVMWSLKAFEKPVFSLFSVYLFSPPLFSLWRARKACAEWGTFKSGWASTQEREGSGSDSLSAFFFFSLCIFFSFKG